MTACKACDRVIEIGQTFIGFPVIRLTALNSSQLAGNEILFHLTCFLQNFKKAPVEIIKP